MFLMGGGGEFYQGSRIWNLKFAEIPVKSRVKTPESSPMCLPENASRDDSGATFQWDDSDSDPKVRVTGQKSELQTKSQSYNRADPQIPNRIAQKRAPNGVYVLLQKTPLKTLLNPPKWCCSCSDHLLRRFREGISFLNFVERFVSENCASPGSVLSCSLYKAEHFSRRSKGQKGAERRGGRGVASRGAKKERMTRENRSVFISRKYYFVVRYVLHGQKTLVARVPTPGHDNSARKVSDQSFFKRPKGHGHPHLRVMDVWTEMPVFFIRVDVRGISGPKTYYLGCFFVPDILKRPATLRVFNPKGRQNWDDMQETYPSWKFSSALFSLCLTLRAEMITLVIQKQSRV